MSPNQKSKQTKRAFSKTLQKHMEKTKKTKKTKVSATMCPGIMLQKVGCWALVSLCLGSIAIFWEQVAVKAPISMEKLDDFENVVFSHKSQVKQRGDQSLMSSNVMIKFSSPATWWSNHVDMSASNWPMTSPANSLTNSLTQSLTNSLTNSPAKSPSNSPTNSLTNSLNLLLTLVPTMSLTLLPTPSLTLPLTRLHFKPGPWIFFVKMIVVIFKLKMCQERKIV